MNRLKEAGVAAAAFLALTACTPSRTDGNEGSSSAPAASASTVTVKPEASAIAPKTPIPVLTGSRSIPDYRYETTTNIWTGWRDGILKLKVFSNQQPQIKDSGFFNKTVTINGLTYCPDTKVPDSNNDELTRHSDKACAAEYLPSFTYTTGNGITVLDTKPNGHSIYPDNYPWRMEITSHGVWGEDEVEVYSERKPTREKQGNTIVYTAKGVLCPEDEMEARKIDCRGGFENIWSYPKKDNVDIVVTRNN